MRKLLLTLMAMIVTAFAFNISAETTTVYVVGAGDGLTWDLPGKAFTGEDGVVSFTVNNLTKFKASTNNSTVWDDEGGFNAGCYGPGETSFGTSVYPNGQTLPMVSWGEDVELPWTGNYTITMDFNKNVMTAKSSTPQPTTAPDVYIRGGMNGWAGTPAAWKFTNVSWTGTAGEWTFTGTIPAGQEFKIADSSWGAINYTLNNTNLTPTLNSPYTAVYNGGNTKLATSFTGTITLKITNYSGHAATITFSEGNGGTVTPSYPDKLFIIGTINGGAWDPANVAAMTNDGEGIYTINSVNLGDYSGTCGFAITGGGSTWNDVNGLRFGPAVQDTKAVVGTNNVDGVGDLSWTIDPGIYKMVFDYNKKTLVITRLNAVTYPETMYVIGNVNGQDWGSNNGVAMTKTGEGTFTVKNLAIGNAGDGTGYFSFAVSLSNDWNTMGSRYGAENNNQPAAANGTYNLTTSYDNAFQVGGDVTMDIDLDLAKMQITISNYNAGSTGPEPGVELEPFDAMFNFDSYEGIAECVPGLPAESSWTADGNTGNIYYTATKAEIDGAIVEPKAHSAATVSNSPRYYKTAAGVYTLRVYNNNTMTISAPEGGYLTSINVTTNTTNSSVAKTTVDSGVLSFDGKNFSWSPTARENISSITLSFGATVQLLNIEVEGEAPEAATPEVPETTWNIRGSYNDDSSWSTPINFTQYNNGVYSTEKINKLVEFKLTNQDKWYGYDGEGYAKLGEAFKVAEGDQYGNVKFGLSGYVQDAVISFNPATLEVTVNGTWVSTALELYVMGVFNDWSAKEEYKLTTEDTNVYTITLKELTAGSEFKIAAANWSPEFTTDNTQMENGTYNIVSGNNMALGKSMTDVTLTLDIVKNTLTVAGTEPTPAELKLSFVGDNFELGDDINEYLTLTDMGVMISSGGESDGKINITSNPFSFVPNTDLGQYMLNLNYKDGYSLTAAVAPGTPEDAQIDVQNGSGNVVIAGKDLSSTLEVIVTITKEVEPSVLYLAQPFTTVPAVDPQSIEEVEPGVYEGVFKFKTGMSYIGFYTIEGDVITKYSKGGFGTFPSDPAAYPVTEDLVKDAATTWSWYIPSLPAGCQGNFNVTVNLNDLTITVDPIYEAAPAPENLYLWGSTNGGVRAVRMADFVKNGNVYTLEDYEISSYGIFDTSDSEGGSTIERGFSFFLCDNGTSFTAAGATRYYGPKAASEDEPDPAIIDLTVANNTYTATATMSGTVDTGGNFIAVTPGLYTLTFNYETKEFKAVLNEAYKQVTFEFVGEGNIADPRRYVTAISMFGEEPETLDLYTNTKLFSYNEMGGVIFALNEGLSEDYTLTVTGPTGIEPGNNTYMIDGSTTEGIENVMVSLLGVDNVTFTVTVGETVDNNAYLGIAEAGIWPSAPNKEYVLTPDATGYVYTGTFTIQPNQSFNFWYPSNILMGDENEDGENVKFQPMGPASGAEVLVSFNSVNNMFEGGIDVNMTGYWTLDSDQPLELTVTVDLTTRSIEVENNTELPEPTPEINALVFEDFEIELGNTPTTVEVPVSIQADETFTYQGIQFTVTLPEGLTIPEEGGIVLNAPLNGNVTWNTSDDLYGAPNTTGVVVLLTEPTEAVEDILTINVTGEYGSLAAGSYPVTIQSVGFSDARGNDIETPEFEAFTGYVTVTEAEVPAEEITIDSVTLNEPSFTEEENDMVSEVVAGESVDMTITVKPADTTDEVEVTADNGATVTENEDGTWTVDTSGVVVPEGEESVTVTITITAGDVEETYELTVKGVLLGDSNDNGVVTVADVVTTANYIAEKPIDAFCFPNANVILTEVDGEQVINSQDITATVNIILGTFDGIRNPQNVRRNVNIYTSNDRLVATNFIAGDNLISVSLENTAQYAALTAIFNIPAGMKVVNVSRGPRAASHDMAYNVDANGKLRIVLYSLFNKTFKEGEGSLFDIAVEADAECGDLTIESIDASDANSIGYVLGFEGGYFDNIATGVDSIGAEDGDVRFFTVDGIEVFNPEAGQILIRVQGDSVSKVVVK